MAKKIASSVSLDTLKDRMANERTFLAWIRTSIGIMAFGFVLERFALFLKQVGYFVSNQGLAKSPVMTEAHQSYSSVFGILLVALGALMGLFSFVHYRKIDKQITNDAYAPSGALATALTVLVMLMGIFLVAYLINT